MTIRTPGPIIKLERTIVEKIVEKEVPVATPLPITSVTTGALIKELWRRIIVSIFIRHTKDWGKGNGG